MKRKICFVTGTRAEYGLLSELMKAITREPSLILQVIVTGTHLSPEFGLTYIEIERDGFSIDWKVEMQLSSDTPNGTVKSMGLGLIGFADAIDLLKPDLLVVLGDRFETFCAVSAALVSKVPVAHIHGGELTEGALDDSLRHAITKMSHLHFVAAEEYRQRVIQLGESPERVYNVGGLGVDAIKHINLLSRSELEESLNFHFKKNNLLITFHPVTLNDSNTEVQMGAMLAALGELNETGLIFTFPNADAGGRKLRGLLQDFVSNHPNAKLFTSLGYIRYLSCMAQVDGVVGNSSSGLLETPTFRKGTINIGDRQKGRLAAKSVIQCEPTVHDIRAALIRLYSTQFQASLCQVQNLYGEGGGCRKILDVIRDISLKNIIKKSFYDLPLTAL